MTWKIRLRSTGAHTYSSECTPACTYIPDAFEERQAETVHTLSEAVSERNAT
mgnify:CR=1 FL=1